MSSHLTISYTSKTAAGTAPAGAPAADAPAADSPLGFLAALLDQLLAGATETTTEAASSAAGTEAAIPGLLDFALDSKTETSTAAAPDPQSLVAGLTSLLATLQTQSDTGESPSADQLHTLNDSIDALSAALPVAPATPTSASPPAAVPVQASELRDRLLALSQSLAATAPALSQKLDTLATQLATAAPAAAPPASPPRSDDAATIADIIRSLLGKTGASDDTADKPDAGANPAPATEDQLLQILATLGLNAQPASGSPPAAEAPPAASASASVAAVPPDLLRLSNQLTRLSAELAPVAPDFAKKLEAVATKLVSSDADPTLLAQVGSAASDRDGAGLEKLVQSLIDAKPAAAPAPVPTGPQIATTTQLEIPAAIVPPKAVGPQNTAPQPVVASTEPTPKLTLTAAAAPAADPEPAKLEAKVATIVVDATKAEPAKAEPAPTNPQQNPLAPPANTAPPRALPAAYQPVANPINMGQIAFEMVRQVHQGNSRFTLRLDPPELGRVDVRMQIDQTGIVNARLTVERAETLDLFQRDQRSLERALAQAGLDSSKTNLEFSLRQNPFANMSGDQRSPQQHFAQSSRFMASEPAPQPSVPAIALYRGTASAGGVNILA